VETGTTKVVVAAAGVLVARAGDGLKAVQVAQVACHCLITALLMQEMASNLAHQSTQLHRLGQPQHPLPVRVVRAAE
jgi:hypothetical protein